MIYIRKATLSMKSTEKIQEKENKERHNRKPNKRKITKKKGNKEKKGGNH